MGEPRIIGLVVLAMLVAALFYISAWDFVSKEEPRYLILQRAFTAALITALLFAVCGLGVGAVVWAIAAAALNQWWPW